jgi:hypothetical protein
LLIDCCRWPPSPESRICVAAAAVRVDWTRFVRLARRHRVEGLAFRGLREAGVPAPEGLAEDARRVARRNLFFVAELIRLDTAFRAAGIDVIFVKGVTLAKLAYGDPGVKSGIDIDILVDPDAAQASALVLETAGYGLTMPAAGADTAAIVRRWHAHAKESVWRHEPSGTILDLHTRLSDSEAMLPGVGMTSPRQAVELAPGRSLPTLASEELFAYLCVHGASSAWFRLKWLADVAALLAQRSSVEIDRLYAGSQALGAGRAADQALLLAGDLFGTRLSEELGRTLRSRRASRYLAAAAREMLIDEREVTERRLGTLQIHLSQLLLRRGLAFKTKEAKRQLLGSLRNR